ncbi:MAG: right-handed parallel beta-helix repeat-containing protein [Planctomycetota bacterium]|nr:MAG: right-handed parallel beta-helix repeat-containing protein [Planctomycetota bacterium]
MGFTRTVGNVDPHPDNRDHSTIQAAVDWIHDNLDPVGDLTDFDNQGVNSGVQMVKVYAIAPDNIYPEQVHASAGFTNAGPNDYIHTTAMIDHTGVAGVGIKIYPEFDASTYCYVVGEYGHFEGFECSVNGTNNIGDSYAIYGIQNCKIYNNIVHDLTVTANSWCVGIHVTGNAVHSVYNNIVYNIFGYFRSYAIRVDGTSDTGDLIYNNTFSNIRCPGGGYGAAIRVDGDNVTFKNNYFDFAAGDGACYEITGANCTHDYNVTSDDAGEGEAHGIGNADPADQFVNPGTDFHLKVAVCIDAGTDLSGIFTDDIDGQTRTGTWDVGADEYSVPPAPPGEGWHGSATRIKILPRDFLSDNDSTPEKASLAGVTCGGTEDGLIASVPIPTGFKATAVRVYASDTRNVTVEEYDFSTSTGTQKGTGDTSAEIDITDVTSTATNLLHIKVQSINSATVHGGYVTIAKV